VSELHVPVLEVGGTHVSAAIVDASTWTVVGEPHRRALDSHADAEQILATFASAGTALNVAQHLPWAVAMPDPFDYRNGIGRFHDVGKFESLDGVDVRTALDAALPHPARIVFVNDADAFTLGEARHGTGVDVARCVGLTLGTGVGSGWVREGHALSTGPGLPRDGRIHHAFADGRPLEDTMSRRAIRRAYADATGDSDADVREIAERARAGETDAMSVLRHALGALGAVLAPRLREFGAQLLVVGGSMSASWDLFEPWLREGLAGLDIAIAVSADTERAALLGAADVAARP
jgi:glucokinase